MSEQTWMKWGRKPGRDSGQEGSRRTESKSKDTGRCMWTGHSSVDVTVTRGIHRMAGLLHMALEESGAWRNPVWEKAFLQSTSNQVWGQFLCVLFFCNLYLLWTASLNASSFSEEKSKPARKARKQEVFLFILFIKWTNEHITGKYRVTKK